MQPQFVHLRMHSEFSVTDSTVRLDSAIGKVKEHNVGALGLTDFNNIFGGLIFYTHAMKAGVKPIVGCDLVIENTSSHGSRCRSILTSPLLPHGCIPALHTPLPSEWHPSHFSPGDNRSCSPRTTARGPV